MAIKNAYLHFLWLDLITFECFLIIPAFRYIKFASGINAVRHNYNHNCCFICFFLLPGLEHSHGRQVAGRVGQTGQIPGVRKV